MGHHKSNQEVEGNPDSGHGRGLPLRPDQAELAERTEEDRQAIGLPGTRGNRGGNGRRTR
ncbi:hypothetical protein [Streptomyces sp. NPDC058045]|uniref:hypothetical protein n=1 Tax=Streptomyces sp. NPDC058045 TaxID=3346311 RepID=UPI0036EC237F